MKRGWFRAFLVPEIGSEPSVAVATPMKIIETKTYCI
jgi:hypothetical protein